MMVDFHSAPLLAMVAIISATLWRGVAIQRETGDRPWAFASAKGVQRIAGGSFALSVAALLIAAALAEASPVDPTILAAVIGLIGAAIVIVAQVQMGRAWRIGVREGDAPLFVAHGLFRFSRNPIFLGMMIVGLSATMVSGTWWSWAALATFVASCAVQVGIEETHLEASFGQSYREFRASVPRWIGIWGKQMKPDQRNRADQLIKSEMAAYRAARVANDSATAWTALERAHIVSQPFLGPHVSNHWTMLQLAVVERNVGEVIGQIARLALAPLGAMTGRIPVGNTGRSNVSAFRSMDLPEDLRRDIYGKSL